MAGGFVDMSRFVYLIVICLLLVWFWVLWGVCMVCVCGGVCLHLCFVFVV